MPDLRNTILSFDHGIESVLPSQPHNVVLPRYSQLIPWDGRVEEQVHQLLLAPSREEQLMQMLGPEHLAPDLLTPGLFRMRLQSGMAWLRERSKEQDAFGDAAEVLEDLDAASRLLDAYRNALRQA